jgi:hypothetical protein
MPMYCYRIGNEVVDVFFPMGSAPKTIRVRGGVARRDYSAESKAVVGVDSGRGWPLECVASGVNASQAGELRDFFSRSGVPTEVTSDGNPVYKNASHRKKALKLRGFVDRSAYC